MLTKKNKMPLSRCAMEVLCEFCTNSDLWRTLLVRPENLDWLKLFDTPPKVLYKISRWLDDLIGGVRDVR